MFACISHLPWFDIDIVWAESNCSLTRSSNRKRSRLKVDWAAAAARLGRVCVCVCSSEMCSVGDVDLQSWGWTDMCVSSSAVLLLFVCAVPEVTWSCCTRSDVLLPFVDVWQSVNDKVISCSDASVVWKCLFVRVWILTPPLQGSSWGTQT